MLFPPDLARQQIGPNPGAFTRCGRDMVSVSMSWRNHLDKKWQRLGLGRLTSRSWLFTSRAQNFIFNQIVQATLIKWAKSEVVIYGSVKPNRLMH